MTSSYLCGILSYDGANNRDACNSQGKKTAGSFTSHQRAAVLAPCIYAGAEATTNAALAEARLRAFSLLWLEPLDEDRSRWMMTSH